MNRFKYYVASEESLIIYAQHGSLAQRNDDVRLADARLREKCFDWLIDTVPAYDSLLIQFDPLLMDLFAIKRALKQVLDCIIHNPHSNTDVCTDLPEGAVIKTLPVWYRSTGENDLQRIALHHDISVEDVIERHTSLVYHVYCCGFSPGFAYMGEVDQRIVMPRLNTPRKKVPKGAVAVADRQTAIYPSESPGGWNIVGLCPVELFDRNANPPTQLIVGDKVKFEAIDEQQYRTLLSKGTQ